MKLTRDNKSFCEREVMLAPGQSLPRGSSLSRVHVNRPLVGLKTCLVTPTPFPLERLSLYSYSINETILFLFKTGQMCYFIFLLLASQLI